MKAITGTVRGRVQGVGFRWFARRNAAGLHLVGWVRNLEDGGVAFFAQGEEEGIAAFLQSLGRGPASGSVDGVDTDETEPDPALSGFEIRD
jgi:acylphosphatase